MSAWLRTGSERSARQQQAFARPLPPDRVPDPVLLTVLSSPFYGVTPYTSYLVGAAGSVAAQPTKCITSAAKTSAFSIALGMLHA